MNKKIARRIILVLHRRFSIKRTPLRSEMEYLTTLLDAVSQSQKTTVTRYGG